jgi:hypothetical protein
LQRYLIIAIAILAGWLVLVLLSKMAGRHIRGEAIMPFRYLIAGAVMIAVMLAGGIWLETGSGSPDMGYQPAQIIDGKIQPGQFNEK